MVMVISEIACPSKEEGSSLLPHFPRDLLSRRKKRGEGVEP